MTAPDVNATSYGISPETSPGVLPATPVLNIFEPNDIGKIGAAVTGKRRQPISKDRLPRGSRAVDLDSALEMEFDMCIEHLRVFMDYLFLANQVGVERAIMYPTAVTGTGYTVASGAVIPNGRLVWVAGCPTEANNGLKLLAGTSTDVEIKTTGLTAEDITETTTNATIEIAGVQGAAGDITLVNGNLATTVLDMTTLGWVAGQMLQLGDFAGGAAYRFPLITDAAYTNGDGFARIVSIAAHLVTLDKNEWIVANVAGGGDDAAAAKTIRLLTGPFLREWPVGHANHNKKYARVEATLPGLDGGVDAYYCPEGNILDNVAIEFPLTELVKMSTTWLGTDTPPPTTVRETWGKTLEPVMAEPFDTTTSWRRKRLCTQAGVEVVTELKDLTMTISNGCTAEKVQALYGAFKINLGDRTAEGQSNWLLDEPDVLTGIREHTRYTLDLAMGGEEGGFYFDFPAVRVSDGSLGLDRNTTVTTAVTIMPEKHKTKGFMVGLTRFPYLP